jgi:DNA adenine methylase
MKATIATKQALIKEALVQPFLKWAGGKRQLLPEIRRLIPKTFKSYFEPFLGGGAVFFSLQPKVAMVNDLNTDLINCYKVIRNSPDGLLEALSSHQNTSNYYYRIRELDRSLEFEFLSEIERAARLIYLNKTCFNGLFRVNSQGHFNVPFGSYKNPVYADPAVIHAVSNYLRTSNITFASQDFAEAVSGAKRGDFVYFDPPYDPVSDTSSFTGYNLHGFGRSEQKRLKDICDPLVTRGVKVLISNSDTPFVRALFGDSRYNINAVKARRNINSVGSARGEISELLITSY